MNATRVSKHLLSASLIALGFALAPVAFAAQSAYLPPERTQGAIAYRSGGVGQDESMAMRRTAPEYPLELEFVAKAAGGHDEYLAGENVVIKDHAGKTVLSAKTDGPYLLAKLPAGRYSVTASRNGKSKEHAAIIAPHERIVFEW